MRKRIRGRPHADRFGARSPTTEPSEHATTRDTAAFRHPEARGFSSSEAAPWPPKPEFGRSLTDPRAPTWTAPGLDDDQRSRVWRQRECRSAPANRQTRRACCGCGPRPPVNESRCRTRGRAGTIAGARISSRMDASASTSPGPVGGAGGCTDSFPERQRGLSAMGLRLEISIRERPCRRLGRPRVFGLLACRRCWARRSSPPGHLLRDSKPTPISVPSGWKLRMSATDIPISSHPSGPAATGVWTVSGGMISVSP